LTSRRSIRENSVGLKSSFSRPRRAIFSRTTPRNLTSYRWPSSGAVAGWSSGSFVDRREKLSRYDGIVTAGITTSDELIVVHRALDAVNEEPIGSCTEGVGKLVEDVETRIRDAAFDFRDGLTADAGGIGKGGLGKPDSGSFDNDMDTKYLPRRRSHGREWALNHVRALPRESGGKRRGPRSGVRALSVLPTNGNVNHWRQL
jgi:hypothetical protein